MLQSEMIRTTTAKPNAFNVLNHGDAWVNNYLFSYDQNNKPTDIMFIDFQLCIWASPVIDLYYFFITSIRSHLKTADHFDNFIYFYHKELISNLKKLKYQKELPTLLQLHMDLIDNGKYGAALTYTFLPIVLLNRRNDCILKNLIGKSKFSEAMYSNPRYIQELESLYPVLLKKGFLNF